MNDPHIHRSGDTSTSANARRNDVAARSIQFGAKFGQDELTSRLPSESANSCLQSPQGTLSRRVPMARSNFRPHRHPDRGCGHPITSVKKICTRLTDRIEARRLGLLRPIRIVRRIRPSASVANHPRTFLMSERAAGPTPTSYVKPAVTSQTHTFCCGITFNGTGFEEANNC